MVGGRILTNTRKHIWRSGWIGFASVFVMTLAFLVSVMFGGLAYVANLYIKHFESQSNMLVFFEVGVDEEVVLGLREEWSVDDRIMSIDYMSEEEAFQFYYDYTSKVSPEQFEALNRYDEKKLPASLEIKVFDINEIESVKKDINVSIARENEKLRLVDITTDTTEKTETDADKKKEDETVLGANTDREEALEIQTDGTVMYKYSTDPTVPPISEPLTDDDNIEIQKNVFTKVRAAGVVALSLLSLFIIIFIFMITEFRLYNQKEEIGVMQLVGGSLFFIRSPYILEGGFYGMVGALLSFLTFAGLGVALFVVKVDEQLSKYFFENFGFLPWPNVEPLGWVAVALGIMAIGFFLGGISSFLAIRRYIR